MAVVYRHIRLDKNEVFYVGIGKTEARPHSVNDRNRYWKNITNKTDYRVDILFDDLTWNEACEKEIEFIELYGRKDLGKGTLVNLTNGGDGSNGAKRNYTDENPSPIKGRKQTDEHKKKRAEARKGKKLSQEVKNKISNSHKGKTHNRGNNLLGKKKPNQKKRLLGSGKGYFFCKKSNKFISRIIIDGKSKHLGRYDNEFDAHNAYIKFYNEKILNTNDK
jgi:hypothetical protein